MFFKKAKQITKLTSTVEEKTSYISELETKVSEMEKLMTPDMREVISLQDKIKDLQSRLLKQTKKCFCRNLAYMNLNLTLFHLTLTRLGYPSLGNSRRQ